MAALPMLRVPLAPMCFPKPPLAGLEQRLARA
jgi:hypothetical protein